MNVMSDNSPHYLPPSLMLRWLETITRDLDLDNASADELELLARQSGVFADALTADATVGVEHSDIETLRRHVRRALDEFADRVADAAVVAERREHN